MTSAATTPPPPLALAWSRHPTGAAVGDAATLTLLVADPDPDAAANIQAGCAADDVTIVSCQDGAAALYQTGALAPDLVLLSTQLPVVPAADVVKAVLAHGRVPIVLSVGPGEADAAVAAVAAGASEVVNRPYQRREVQALVAEHLSRTRARRQREAVLEVGSLALNVPAHQVLVAGALLDLGRRDFDLLRVLMLQAGRVVEFADLRRQVWGAEVTSSNTLAVHISRLRVLLGSAVQIMCVRGVGYRLTVR